MTILSGPVADNMLVNPAISAYKLQIAMQPR